MSSNNEFNASTEDLQFRKKEKIEAPRPARHTTKDTKNHRSCQQTTSSTSMSSNEDINASNEDHQFRKKRKIEAEEETDMNLNDGDDSSGDSDDDDDDDSEETTDSALLHRFVKLLPRTDDEPCDESKISDLVGIVLRFGSGAGELLWAETTKAVFPNSDEEDSDSDNDYNCFPRISLSVSRSISHNLPKTILFEFCYERLSRDNLLLLFRELIRRIPNLPLLTPEANKDSFLNWTVSNFVETWTVASQADLELIRLLAHPDLAVRKNEYGRTPLNLACSGYGLELSAGLVEFLLGLSPQALEIADNEGFLPLHYACDPILFDNLPGIQRMVDLFPEALVAKNNEGWTPIMIALKMTEPRHDGGPRWQRYPELVEWLSRMIQQAPESIQETVVDGSEDSPTTGLYTACTSCPDANLVSVLMHVHPVALIIETGSSSLLPCEAAKTQQYASQQVKDHVDSETFEMLLALLEPIVDDVPAHRLLSEDSQQRVSTEISAFLSTDFEVDSISDSFVLVQSLRAAEGRLPLWQFCKNVLHDTEIQRAIQTNQPLRKLAIGIYRMNKLGRADPGRTLSPLAQISILDSVHDNLDCLFLRLRECPSLFPS